MSQNKVVKNQKFIQKIISSGIQTIQLSIDSIEKGYG